MNSKQEEKLNKVLVNVGDFGYKRKVLEVIGGLSIKPWDNILDCGCGDGFYTMVISYLYPGVNVIGVDYDEKMLKQAKKWQPENKFVCFKKAKVENLPFRSNFFDKIVLSEVLEHLEDDLAGLKEAYRVLKPKGILAITVPNHNYPFFWDPFNWTREKLGFGHFDKDKELLAGIWSMHLRLYLPQEIINLVEKASLKILKVKLLTHYCIPFSQVFLHLGKNFYTKLPVSKSILNKMEKFNWEKAEGNERFSFIRLAQSLFEKVDRLNEKKEVPFSQSSQGILLICQK